MELNISVVVLRNGVTCQNIDHQEIRLRLKRLIQSVDGKNAIIMDQDTCQNLSLTVRSVNCDYYIANDGIRSVLEKIFNSSITYDKIWIWGGQLIWNDAISTGWVVHIDHLFVDIPGSGERFPEFNPKLYRSIHSHYTYQFNLYKDVPGLVTKYQKICLPFEVQYRNMLKKLLDAPTKVGRNGNTRSLSGEFFKIDLTDGFPILTGRKVFWRGIVEELAWFLKGSTNVKYLQDRGIYIWDKNSSADFLAQRGLKYPQGELGPVYGYQFRNGGGLYPNRDVGVDQLFNAIRDLRRDPHNRRVIISLWSVLDIEKMALPPCTVAYQFTVSEDRLHGHLMQRSQDLSLGWNISTLALLTHIISHEVEIPVGTISQMVGDIHIYECHIPQLKEYLQRCPYPLPKLGINGPLNLNDLSPEQFQLRNYVYHPAIKMEMIA